MKPNHGRTVLAQIQNNQLGIDALKEYTKTGPIFIQANAMVALVGQFKQIKDPYIEESILETLYQVAADEQNKKRIVMGFISVAYMAIKCIHDIGTPDALRFLQTCLDSLSDDEREDVLWLLGTTE